MKKFVIAFLISASIFFSLVFSLGNLANAKHEDFQVAMITDIADGAAGVPSDHVSPASMYERWKNLRRQ